MTTTLESRPTRGRTRAPLQTVAGAALVLAALTNGVPQAVTHLVTGDLGGFSEQIRWSTESAANGDLHRAEQLTLLVSSLFMPVGLLGLAWVAHHTRRRLAGVAAVLVVLGMWGFHNVLALGYTVGTVAPPVVGTDGAVALNDALVDDPGVMATALYPHLLCSFLGLVLLAVACWRSGAFPRTPLVLMVLFLVWDFGFPPVGPLEPHLVLVVAWCWLGVHLLRLPRETWEGGAGRGRAAILDA